MPAPSDLSMLLRLYTGKQNNPTVGFTDFCDYLNKYARHYLEENPELVLYLEDTATVVTTKLNKMEDGAKPIVSTDAKGRKTIFVPQFYIDRIIQRYKEIDEHPEIPFPLATEIPHGASIAFLKPIYIATDFTNIIEKSERSNTYLNQLIFPDEIPPFLFPGAISPEKLLDLALNKVRYFFRKDESRDYIQKRMMVANPGKELSVKDSLNQFMNRPSEAIRNIKHAGDAYLFWSYLCGFIRQDYSKKNEKTPEEIALLQSIYVIEFLNNHYRNKAQQDLHRQTALKNLELTFLKSPYYYDMDSILRFTDSRGVPLLGQYQRADLESFIKEKTGGNDTPGELPALLVFKTEAENRYFVLKDKVIALVVKLCGDSRKLIKDTITRQWYQLLTSYRQEAAMKNQADFEKKLQDICRTTAPVLHALLGASFISLMATEVKINPKGEAEGFRMFNHGRLLPLSELLMLNRHELVTDTRILLPFWFTLPIISSIIAFFRAPRKKKPARHPAHPSATEKNYEHDRKQDIVVQRKVELKGAVAAIERTLIPEGSSLEGEMDIFLEKWNRTLDMNAKSNLTEDVKSLVRDYVRRVVRTLRASTFDSTRVENLATALVNTPSLMKIPNQDALLQYIRLYILFLVKNIQ